MQILSQWQILIRSLACGQSPPQDWLAPEQASRLIRHGLHSLTHLTCGTISPWDHELLKHHFSRHIETYRHFQSVLVDFPQLIIILKGLSLAALYQHPESRVFSDLDLYARHTTQMDWHNWFGTQPDFDGGTPNVFDYQISKRSLRTQGVAELHADLAEAGRLQNLERELAGAQPSQRILHWAGEDIICPVMPPDLEVIYLCQHFMAHGFGAKLLWILDLANVLRHSALNPSEIVHRAQNLQLDRGVRIVFYVHDILIRGESDMALNPYEAWYAKAYLHRLDIIEPRERIFFTRLMASQGFSAKVRMIHFYMKYLWAT